MSPRAALTVTVLLLPVGLTATLPLSSEIVPAPAAYADTPPVDDLTDENSPPEYTNAPAQPTLLPAQPTPPPASAPVTAPAPMPATPPLPGQPAAAPVAPSTLTPRRRQPIIVVPPKPADTLTSAVPHAARRLPAAGSGAATLHARSRDLAALRVNASAASPSTVDTPALVAPGVVPKGGVQAGGGATAPAHEISRLGVLLTTVALAVVAAGSGLRRRRQRIASEVAYHTRSRAC